MAFAQTLEKLMKERGMSNYRLAKLLDISQSTISAWMSGSSLPRRSTMKLLAEVFGVSVEYLNGETDDETVSLLENLRDEERALLQVARSMTADEVRTMTEFAKKLKGIG